MTEMEQNKDNRSLSGSTQGSQEEVTPDTSARPFQAEEFFDSVFTDEEKSRSVANINPAADPSEASTLDYSTGLAGWRNHHMAAVHDARDLALDVIDSKNIVQDTEAVEDMLQRVSTYYLNADQYHNAEHMYYVAAYTVRLGELAGLPQDEASVLTRVTAAAYHDAGNGQFPGAAGADERDAISVFLRDAKGEDLSVILTADRTAPLEALSGEQRLQVVSSIAATVFRDRHASKEALLTKDYVNDIADLLRTEGPEARIDDDAVQTYAQSLGMSGSYSLANVEEVLAEGMVSKEALVLKHADLSGSLSPVASFKNHITNRWEDQVKPHLAQINDPQKYQDGFVAFASGLFHDKADQQSPLYKDARGEATGTPSVFMGIDAPGDGGVADFGIRKLVTTSATINEIISNHNELLTHVHEMIRDEQFNVPAQPIGRMIDRLEERGLDLTQYPGLQSMPEELREKTFAAASYEEINNAFIPDITLDYTAMEAELFGTNA